MQGRRGRHASGPADTLEVRPLLGREMTFRFVHIADVHLDSPLRSLALRDLELAELVGTASRRAFSRAVDLCLEESVDALLIAGDLYDGDQTSMRTALYLGAELKRLDAKGIRTFVIRGNHDHLSRITRELVLPESVTVFGGRADIVVLEDAGIAIHGLSYGQAHAVENLLPKYKPRLEGVVNIGLLHTSLGGAPGHDPYAPCSVSDLEASGFDYWALGHIHARSVTTGRCRIVMPGMLQGRDIGEAGAKSASLVMVADDGTITIEERLTSLAQFERVTIDVSAASDWRDVARSMGAALAAAREAATSEHLVACITLTGSTTLAWRLRRDADLLLTEAKAHVASLRATWVDKLEIAVVPQTAAPNDGSPFGELYRSMLGEVGSSATTIEAVRVAIEDLRRQMPPESRDLFGNSEEAVEALARRLTATGSEEVLARLIPTAEPS